MENVKYWIWLSRIEGISSKILIEVLSKYKSPEILWNKTKEELIDAKEGCPTDAIVIEEA